MSEKIELKWKNEVPLLRNFNLFRIVTFVIGVVSVFLFLALFLANGLGVNSLALSSIFKVCLTTAVVLFLMFFISVLIILGNRYVYEYSIGEKGVKSKGADNRSKALATFATISGLTSGKPGYGIVGILNGQGDEQQIEWNNVKEVRCEPFLAVVHVRKSFVDYIDLYCTVENYDKVCSEIEKYWGKKLS